MSTPETLSPDEDVKELRKWVHSFPWFAGVALRIELRNKEIDSLRTRLAEVEKELAELKTKLAYAEDAAAKGDLARQCAGGMELEIKELKESNAELVKDKNGAIELLKEFASKSADFMEGAGLPEFKIYEDQMCWATQTLHKLGIWFDPISGITKNISKGGMQ